jgi:hypothetical protein
MELLVFALMDQINQPLQKSLKTLNMKEETSSSPLKSLDVEGMKSETILVQKTL